MSRTYSKCFYCGGEVEEQYMPRELRWQEKWYILENVPVGFSRRARLPSERSKYLYTPMSLTLFNHRA
jgi:hypothetical protein